MWHRVPLPSHGCLFQEQAPFEKWVFYKEIKMENQGPRATREKSYSEGFVSGHPAQEAEE